jgi:hypothetical protein
MPRRRTSTLADLIHGGGAALSSLGNALLELLHPLGAVILVLGANNVGAAREAELEAELAAHLHGVGRANRVALAEGQAAQDLLVLVTGRARGVPSVGQMAQGRAARPPNKGQGGRRTVSVL